MSKTVSACSKQRIILDFPEKKVQEIDDMMKQGNIKTRTELFRLVLGLFIWALEQMRNGRRIVSKKEGENDIEVVIPIGKF
jgi:metal-responsive CopG/Arc/MetJ family transcriptional regulator